jgi:hypothetical protein
VALFGVLDTHTELVIFEDAQLLQLARTLDVEPRELHPDA